MGWYIHALKNYAKFNGRARRREYWMFSLSHLIILALILWLSITIETDISGLTSILSILYMIVTLIPHLAVLVRRLHDTNQSGWFYLISFIPFIGPIVLLIFLCKEGTKGDNHYGLDTKIEQLKNNFIIQ
ncbi:DUF805 domain-containing protein [Hafnia paralvei]|uniref:DUF805 domain-containing protein n=1 Tax=Hafnia paralvei TaxID=546367 RepID=UPI0018F08404|nr:DUF805 domain-containing protein [Hafnia paralvei]MBW2959000.1 DUF805 domain-containing protein [Hafnia paralvei]MCQ4169128.1 DUF805 domain-containing protein [Hafnia paralvei]